MLPSSTVQLVRDDEEAIRCRFSDRGQQREGHYTASLGEAAHSCEVHAGTFLFPMKLTNTITVWGKKTAQFNEAKSTHF